MEYVSTNYSEEELAWVSPEITLHRDIYLMVTLQTPGKLVIRQDCGDGKKPKAPLCPHKNTTEFKLRIRVLPETANIQLFTSSQPKEIKYAYI